MNNASKHLKLLATMTALAAGVLFIENGYASGNGFYIGGMLGHSSMDYTSSNQHFSPAKRTDHSGFAWNAQGGYQFNRNVALQADFTDYHDANFKNMRNIPGAKANYSQKTGDLVGKLILPLGAFSLSANAGLAYVALDRSANGTAKAHGMNPGDKDAVKLTYGLGAAYDISPNLSALVDWKQIPKGHDIEQSNFIGAGLNYYFN